MDRRGHLLAALAHVARASLPQLSGRELHAEARATIEAVLGAPVRIDETGQVTSTRDITDPADADFLDVVSLMLEEVGRRHAIEAELRYNSERLSAIVDTVAEGILILDAKGLVTFANAAAERMLRRPRRSLIGRDRRGARIRPHHVDGRPIKDAESLFERVSTSGKPVFGEERRMLRPDRTFIDVTANAAAVRDLRGTTSAVVISFIDSTERRRVESTLRESEERLQAIVGSTFDGVVALDCDGRIVEFNRAAEKIFRRSRAEVMGQPAQILMPQALRGPYAAAFQQRQAAPTKEFSRRLETTGMRGDGTEFPAEVSITALSRRGRTMYVAAVRDLTQRP
jgi:hypothetical protein